MLLQFDKTSQLVQLPWSQASKFHVIASSITLLVFSILFGLYQLLRPVDRLPASAGKKWKLPPGPGGLPFVGNLFLYGKGELAARDIARYGEMTTTHLGSKLWIVLNSNRLVMELYARKGSLTNGRPEYPMVSELISQGRRSLLLPINEWNERRRVMHQLLSGTALVKYQDYQDQESVALVERYLKKPQDCPSGNDKMAAVTKAQNLFPLNVPPYNFWDCFPELSRLPRMLQRWRQKYEAMGQFTSDAYSAYWTPILRDIEEGKGPQSFARDLIMGEGKYTGSEVDKMFLSMQLVEAGSDTTRLVINIAILATITNPDKFLKARAEVDSICGANAERLPSFKDEPSLPYVSAFSKDLLRWRRIFGAHFVINHVAMAENPDLFEEPLRFLPERWLDGHETDITGGSWQFGGGRRVCVGQKLAQKSLFINLARLIYTFDFLAREAFDDKDIAHFTEGEPFPISVKVRGEKFAQLIVQSAQKLRDQYNMQNNEDGCWKINL